MNSFALWELSILIATAVDRTRDVPRKEPDEILFLIVLHIENEVHTAHEEYLKLESHIKLYITEMEQCI